MARLRYRDLGSFAGACACCSSTVELQFRESRFVRTWSDLLDRTFDPAVQRTASCAACGSTYPVRAHDRTPALGAQRTTSNAPRRASDPVTYLPGRDWRDTSVRG